MRGCTGAAAAAALSRQRCFVQSLPHLRLRATLQPSPRRAQSSQSYRNGEHGGSFSFSRVFDEAVSQAALYEAILAQPVARAVAEEGRHAHVFAYGAPAPWPHSAFL